MMHLISQHIGCKKDYSTSQKCANQLHQVLSKKITFSLPTHVILRALKALEKGASELAALSYQEQHCHCAAPPLLPQHQNLSATSAASPSSLPPQHASTEAVPNTNFTTTAATLLTQLSSGIINCLFPRILKAKSPHSHSELRANLPRLQSWIQDVTILRLGDARAKIHILRSGKPRG